MKKILKFLISLSVGLIIFIILLQLVGWENITKAILLIFSFDGFIILVLTLAALLVSTFKWRFIFKTKGHNLSFKELAKFWFAGFTLSYLTPIAVVGGEAARIFLVQKKYPFLPLSRNIAVVAIDKILDVTIFLLFLIAGVWIFSFYGWFPNTTFTFVAIAVITGLLIGVLFFYLKSLKNESIIDLFLRLLGIKNNKIIANGNSKILFDTEKEVFSFFNLRLKSFWQGLGLSLLRYSILFLRAVVLIFFLKGNIEIVKSLVVFGFSNLALLLPLPATIGGLEVLEALVFGVMGLGFDNSVVFSMVWRSADLFLCLIGAILLVKYGVKLAELSYFNLLKLKKKK